MPRSLLDPMNVPKNPVLRTAETVLLIPVLAVAGLAWVSLTYLRVLVLLSRIVQGKITKTEPHGWPLD